MGLVEWSIIYIIGALGTQNYLRGIQTVWWKEMLGILFWFILIGYISIKVGVEIVKRVIGRNK